MTAPLYTMAKWCLGILPVDAAGRRCFDETLADWRTEGAKAHGGGAAISARALCSIARCIVLVSAREISSREGVTPLLRIAAWSAVAVAVFSLERSLQLSDAGRPIGPAVVLLGSVPSVFAFMPLLAFVSGAAGRRLPGPSPRLGPALAIGFVVFVAVGWMIPAAFQAQRELLFGLTGGRGPVPPGLTERSSVELVPMLFSTQFARVVEVINVRLLFTAAVPVLLAIGITVRSMAGGRRLAGSVLPLAVFGLPVLAQLDPPVALVWMWPSLLGAVLLTRGLARGADRERCV